MNTKVVGGAAIIPNGFKLLEIPEKVMMRVEAPDGNSAEIPLYIKLYNDDEFFKSIEEFKETFKLKEDEGETNG